MSTSNIIDWEYGSMTQSGCGGLRKGLRTYLWETTVYRNPPQLTSPSWLYNPSENRGCMNNQTAYINLRNNSAQYTSPYNEHHHSWIWKHEPRRRQNQKERTTYLSLDNTTLQNTILFYFILLLYYVSHHTVHPWIPMQSLMLHQLPITPNEPCNTCPPYHPSPVYPIPPPPSPLKSPVCFSESIVTHVSFFSFL